MYNMSRTVPGVSQVLINGSDDDNIDNDGGGGGDKEEEGKEKEEEEEREEKDNDDEEDNDDYKNQAMAKAGFLPKCWMNPAHYTDENIFFMALN